MRAILPALLALAFSSGLAVAQQMPVAPPQPTGPAQLPAQTAPQPGTPQGDAAAERATGAAREQDAAAPQGAAPAQQAPGLSAGAPEVQGAAPEVGAGRGGPNAAQPQTSEPAPATGLPRTAAPQVTTPQAPTPVAPIAPPAPFAARERFDATELELQAALRGGVIEGRVSIPNQSAGILIQPDGRDWRQFRNQVLKVAGIVLLGGVLVALVLFYLVMGPKRIDGGRSGRRIQRFTLAERVNHWMTSTAFVVLALTGLNITYGVYVLRPLIGPQAFTTVTYWAQAAHHYVAFAFIAGVLVMLVHWARENVPDRTDLAWIRAGGPLAKGHPPARKFNAGQKGLYWLTTLGGIAVSVSGLLLMLPYLLDDVILNQWAHIAHGVLAFGMMAVVLGHIYIGSVGMEGAFEAMRDGEVDYNWAHEHHRLWVEEELARARSTVAPDALPPRAAAAD